LLGIDFVNCGYNFGVLGDAESSNKSIRKKGGKGKMYSFAYSVMKNNLNKKELKRKREKEVEKKRKYI
jgi:hypothetical protein